MAQSGTVADMLSPWPLFPVQESDPFIKKTLLTTINWVNSNLKGMAFGIMLGAAFLTLFSYIKLPDKPGRFRNTLYGLLLGTPLGVCVNCAAPVFKGILESRRIELALATMLSSPTLNIIVLTMVFTLFPFYMGIVKVGFTLCCIFIGIPLISKLLGDAQLKTSDSTTLNWLTSSPEATCSVFLAERWHHALFGVLTDYWSRLKFIGIRLIPLMLLAGFLGALLSQLIPNSLFESQVTPLTIVVAAFFGVLLPLPIAFDVILVNAFYAQGLAEPIVLVLLCSLGIVSLFSMMVVWTSVSKQWSLSLMTVCFCFTILVGMGADKLHQEFYVDAKLDEFHALRDISINQSPIETSTAANASLSASLKTSQKVIFTNLRENKQGATISVADFNPPQSTYQKPFEHLEGFEIGLSKGFQYGIRDYTDPFWVGRGTAAGDYDKDGWPDILFGSNNGFVLYRNLGGTFQEQRHPNTAINNYHVFAVAFIDLDNNGWLDIFFSTFDHGNFVIHNSQDGFNYDAPQSVPNNRALLTVSPAFADIDQNGLLDVINGNMALGVITGSHHLAQRRNNSIVFNGGNEFRDVALEKTSGETMSTLVSDINNDGYPDLYFSNDFIVPDKILLGTGKGFKKIKGNEFLAYTPFFSMSADSGDINNDLKLDILTSGTTAVAKDVGELTIDTRNPLLYTKFKGEADTCSSIKDASFKSNCRSVRASNYIDIIDQKRNISFDKCHDIKEPTEKQSCLLAVMWHLVTQNPSVEDCANEFKTDERLVVACESLKHQGARYNKMDLALAIPQDDSNMLYRFQTTTRSFSKVANYKHPGGWTWNSKIVDLDNDGWQDVFNAEGAIRKSGYGWNVLMKNNNGEDFEQKQFSFGLTSDFGLYSFALLDMDNDGDLDIIGNSAEGPVQVYKNHSTQRNNSIAISLRDSLGNYYGIGAKVEIHYDQGKKHQMREIKASGGYMSFDPAIAYFGLADITSVDEIKVQWSDNKMDVYPGPFATKKRYQIQRN